MIRRWLVVFLIADLLGIGCVRAVASQTVLTFFYIVNASGRDVMVRTSADGRELFVNGIEAIQKANRRETRRGR